MTERRAISELKANRRAALNCIFNLQCNPNSTSAQLSSAQVEYERCCLAVETAQIDSCGDAPEEMGR